MAFEEARGRAVAESQREVRRVNVERVREWIDSNPMGLQRQCAVALGLSRATISSINQQLKKEELAGS